MSTQEPKEDLRELEQKEIDLDEALHETQLLQIRNKKREIVTGRIKALIQVLATQLKEEKTMNIKVPSRSKDNLLKQEGIYVLNKRGKKVLKTLNTKGGATSILKILKILQYILTQYEKDLRSTLRELFYNALNWVPEAQFETVNSSNRVLEDIEILLNCTREDFNILAESDGVIAGPLTIEVKTRTGVTKVIDCQKDIPSSGFLLPRCAEEVKIIDASRIENILVLETRGCFARLVESNKDTQWKTLLCSTAGQPSRCIRKFLKTLSEKYDKPIFIFNDGDGWGLNIMLSLSTGSIQSAHLNQKICTPKAKLIGLLPSQIEQYGLPVDDITPLERRLLESLKTDPRVSEVLLEEIEIMLKNGVKSEQQALMYHGFEFMGEYYLPHLMKKHGARGMEHVIPKMDLKTQQKIRKKRKNIKIHADEKDE